MDKLGGGVIAQHVHAVAPVDEGQAFGRQALEFGGFHLGAVLLALEAGQAASRVAAIPEVRAALVAFQRRFARREGGAVLDGRDIGTVICPEAEVKLYVTASAEVRAHRRWREVGGDEARVLAELLERDARDTGRADAPLRAAPDAVVIDTSAMDIDAAVEAACARVAARLARG